MGRRVMTTVVCDLAHDDGEEHPASETLQFSVDGAPYALDLCPEHAEDVYDELGALVAAARRVRRGAPTRR